MPLEDDLLRHSYDFHLILPNFGIDYETYRRDIEDEYLRLIKNSELKASQIHAKVVVDNVVNRYNIEKAKKSSE